MIEAIPVSFVFIATHVTSQALQPKSVNKRYRGATRLSVSISKIEKPGINTKFPKLLLHKLPHSVSLSRCADS